MSSSTPGLTGEIASAEHFGLIRRMADDLAHELKNPLNSMVINLEVLRTRVLSGRSEAALERIDVIESEVRRLHLLLDQMLRVIRPDRMGVDSFPVDEVLSEAGGIAQVLAKLARRTFALEPLGEEVIVRASRESLRLAVLLLAEAAIQASPDDQSGVHLGGEVAVDHVLIHVDGVATAGEAMRAAAAQAERALSSGGIALAEMAVADGCRMTMTLPRGA